jgi:uncharacterized membrane protein YraQ (UPF0718 family)
MSIRTLLAKIGSTRLFLLIVFLIYLIVGAVDLVLIQESLFNFFQLVLKILPVLVLVFGMMFLSNLFLDAQKALKYLGKKSGIKGWFLVIITGILSTGPIYMWYPLLADLKEKGMRASLIATFLYNRAVKIPLMPMMIYYFGWKFTLVLTFYMIMFSVINGFVVERVVDENKEVLK